MANCSECGAYYRGTDDSMPWQSDEGINGCCSKYCFERSWAETMDGYDVDDPDNPAYSNNASYSSNKTNGCLGDIIAIAVVLIGILLGSWLL